MTDKGWQTDELQELFQAVLALKTPDECARFLRDLLTEDELGECAQRWRTVRLIENGHSYRDISKRTGLSTATITRVAKWLNEGMGGYRLILERLKHLHSS